MNHIATAKVVPFGRAEEEQKVHINPHDPQYIQDQIALVVQKTGDLLVGSFFPADTVGEEDTVGELILPSLEHISKNIIFYSRMLSIYLRIIVENPGKISRDELAQLKYKDNMALAELLSSKKLLSDKPW